MIIALNHKSNFHKEEWEVYQERLKEIETHHTLIVCPSMIHLSKTNLPFSLGVQNVSAYEEGAYTGEVTAGQCKSYGIEYAIIGHSERRIYQKESNEEIAKKISLLLQNEIIPILCVGESKEERENHQVWEILKQELETATNSLTEAEKKKVIIAYEPIWSIGTGLIPTKEEIEEVITLIKTILPWNKILYGGSANEENIVELKMVNGVDGYLLGGLSLHPEKLKIFLERLN